jgi:hypothetical protein
MSNTVRFVPGGLMAKVRPLEVPPPGVGLFTATVAEPTEMRSDDRICAVSEVLDRYVVGTGLPFHKTCELERNCVPLTVRVNAAPPTVALKGEIEVTLGVGLAIVKFTGLDRPPPGAGFCTATVAVPAELRSDAGTCAVSEVLDTCVVPSAAPFHSMIEAGMKPLPDAVTVSAALPAVAEFGVNPLTVGTGFCGVCGEPPPPFDPPPPLQPARSHRTKGRKKRSFQLARNLWR